ncbi:MAG TPA: arginase family protein [Solirubrobacterales bacterium]|nr:arginase family protein [Solirubrobacterales bacterium]
MTPSTMTWELSGVPYTSAREPGGIAEAIGVLRECGLAERLGEAGVEDEGDLALGEPSGERGASGLLNEAALAELFEAGQARVSEARMRGRRPLLVGGDCPVLLGPLAAIRVAGDRPGLVMIDGHEDAWPPGKSDTGEGSDSEIAIALGRVPALPAPLAEAMPVLTPAAIAQLGPRDLAELEEAGVPTLRNELACFASGEEVATGEEPAEALIRRAAEAIEADGFWLHVDLDVLATAELRAVDYPQPGGLDWRALERMSLAAARDPRCRGASVVIYNPGLDPDRTDAGKLVEYLARLVA